MTAVAARRVSSLAFTEPDQPCIAESGGGGKDAFCRVPALTPGHYTLRWGGRALRIDVPSEVARESRCLV